MKTKSLIMTTLAVYAFASSLSLADNMVQPDNSAVNQRDRSAISKTADHQAKAGASDVEITRMIRREITKTSDFSTNAKNVKIITKDGLVTLRGPVASNSEKSKIDSITQKVAGQNNVQNELEIIQ